MDLAFTEEQNMIRDMVRDFVNKEIRPVATEIDVKGKIPDALISQGKELGLFGIPFPEEYGGAGMGEVGYCIMQEELTHGCNSFAGMIGAHVSISATSLYQSGTEDQKQTYLALMCRGEKIGAYALTEAEAGSDAASITTSAVQDGDHWVLNGTKQWITNGMIADVFIVFAVTDKGKKASERVTCFIVDRDSEGISVGIPDDKMGLNGMHSPDIVFDNVRVPAKNIVGEIGQGFLVAMKALDVGRLGLGAVTLGAAKEMLNLSVAHASQRKTFGKPIAEHQAIQIKLAEMTGMIYAMDSMIYRTAWMCDKGLRFSRESAIVKYFCTESLTKITDMALQIHGGMGYMKEMPIERFYRDSRVYQIYEGTNEIQRMVIARDVLKNGGY